MNLADWLRGPRASERLQAVETLCRAAPDLEQALDLDPAHIQMSGNDATPSRARPPPGRYRPPMAQAARPCPSPRSSPSASSFEILSGRDFESRGGPPGDLRPDLPRDVSDAVQACLEMDAEWRPKDVSYLLSAAGAGRQRRRELEARVTWRTFGVHRGHAGEPRATRRPPPRDRGAAAFALVALAVSVGIAVALAPPHRGTGAAAAPAFTAPAAPVATTMPAPITLQRRDRDPGRPPARDMRAHARPGTFGGASSRPRGGRASAWRGLRPWPPPLRSPWPLPPTTLAAATPHPSPPRGGGARGPGRGHERNAPLLPRGANVLVDVHGVGFRSDHQARISRPKGGRERGRGDAPAPSGPRCCRCSRTSTRARRPAATSPSWIGTAPRRTPRPFEIGK